MQSLRNGTRLGVYTVIQLVARGGMGEVYEAHEVTLQRKVALKIIAPKNPDQHDLDELIHRFMQEARTLARVNHPNIVTIYTVDTFNSVPFIAMEYVEGASFKELLKRAKLEPEMAAPLFEQMLEGLRCLHDNGIIHRDLKPHNILIRADRQIKILDFGIAKHASAGEFTRVGVVVGTLPYMAPELKTGVPASPQSDFWSLGAIFFECLYGVPLMVAMRDSVQDQEVPFPEDSAVPHEMRAIVNRMCAFRASDRYASAVQAIEDLRRFQMSRSLPTAKEWGEIGETIQDIIQVRKATTAKIEIPKIEKPAAPRIKAPPLKPKIDPVDALVLEDHPTAPSHTNATYRRREAIRIERTNNRPKWIIAAVFASVALFAAWTRFHSAKSNAPVAKAHQPLPEPLVLIQPSDQEEFVLSKTRTPTFEWTRALRPDEYDIQIATDSAFKQIVVQEAVAGRSYRPERQLTEGLYFWRLRPKKPNLLAPTAYRFTVAPRTPVRLIAPAAQHVFILMPRVEYMDIDVRWECKPVAKAYRIQASTRPDFSRAFVDRKLSACKTQIEKLDAGRYFWRVRMESVDGEEEPWSQGLSFTVQDAKASRLPTSRSN